MTTVIIYSAVFLLGLLVAALLSAVLLTVASLVHYLWTEQARDREEDDYLHTGPSWPRKGPR